MILLSDKKQNRIVLGKLDENLAQKIQFDITDWTNEYGSGVVSLLVRRPSDTEPYPIVLDQDGNIVTWTVRDVDVSEVGYGQAELIYTVGELRAKSRIFDTVIQKALTGSADTPDPYQDWVSNVIQKAAEVEENREAVEELAEEVDGKTGSLTERVETVENELEDKQDKLVAGENITIENGVISAKGGDSKALVVVDVNSTPSNPELIPSYKDKDGNTLTFDEVFTLAGSGIRFDIPLLSYDPQMYGAFKSNQVVTTSWDTTYGDGKSIWCIFELWRKDLHHTDGAMDEDSADLVRYGKMQFKSNNLKMYFSEECKPIYVDSMVEDYDFPTYVSAYAVKEYVDPKVSDINLALSNKAEQSDVTYLDNKKADKVDLEATQDKLDVLWKLNEGISYDFQDVQTDAYSVDTPNGGVLADVEMLGGKTIVMNQMVGDSYPKIVDDEIYSQTIEDKAKSFDLDSLGGKSVVWNQRCSTLYTENWASTKEVISDQKIKITTTRDNQQMGFVYRPNINWVANHKYYISLQLVEFNSSVTSGEFRVNLTNNWTNNGISTFDISKTRKCAVINALEDTPNDTIPRLFLYFQRASGGVDFSTGDNFTLDNVMCIDLTVMFGQGSEPTLAQCQQIFIDDYYPYNTGEIISANVGSVDVKGVNLFDGEHAERTRLYPSGTELATVSAGYSVFMKLEPNTTYSISKIVSSRGTVGIATELTAGASCISYNALRHEGTITTDDTHLYLVWLIWNITDDGDGLPFETIAKSITIVKGSTIEYNIPYHSESIQLPQLDLKSAGTAHDVVERRTYHNMKSVDLGSLNWSRTTSYSHPVFYVDIADAVLGTSQLCNELINVGATVNASSFSSVSVDKSISKCSANNQLFARYDSCTTVAELKQALNGVILHYEASSGGSDYSAWIKQKNVGSVDLGSLNWSYYTSVYGNFRSSSINSTLNVTNANRSEYDDNLLCEKFTPTTRSKSNANDDKYMWIDPTASYSGGYRLVIKDSSYTTLDSFKSAMNGVILYYELDTPQILDITSQMPNLSNILCEQGGTITFTQDDLHLTVPVKETLALAEWNQPLNTAHKYNKNGTLVQNASTVAVVGGQDYLVDMTRAGVEDVNAYVEVSTEKNDGELVTKQLDNVVVKGKNLFPLPSRGAVTDHGVTYANNYDGTITVRGVATDYSSYNIYIGASVQIPKGVYKLSGVATGTSNIVWSSFGVVYIDDTTESFNITGTTSNATVTFAKDVKAVSLAIKRNNNNIETKGIVKPMLEKGSTATSYVPYREPQTIPTASLIQKYFPNGMHSAGTVYDYFDFDRGVAVKNVDSVDLGSLTWQRVSFKDDYYGFRANTSQIPNIYPTRGSSYLNNLLCERYENAKWNVGYDGKDKTISQLSNVININDFAYTDTGTFKSTLNGVLLYYELETSTETPIDEADLELLRRIAVEGGGSITFASNDESLHLPIPNKIEYLRSLREVNNV